MLAFIFKLNLSLNAALFLDPKNTTYLECKVEIRKIEIVSRLEYISLKVDIIYFVNLKYLLLAHLLKCEDLPMEVHKGDRTIRAAT